MTVGDFARACDRQRCWQAVQRHDLLAGEPARRERQEQRSGFGRADSFAVIR